jgi:hypothetical protein
MSSRQAAAEASSISQSRGGSGSVASIPHFFRLDFAYSTRTVLYIMAGIMAVAAIAALLGLRAGAQEEEEEEAPAADPGAQEQVPAADPGPDGRHLPDVTGTDDPVPG